MGRAERWDDELAELAPTQWPAFLTEHSGLPGPRANLRLVAAAARMADDATVELLAGSTDEYLLTCAAAALGRRADDAGARRRARALASCGLWRVRLGVEQGLQMLGDKDPEALRSVVEAWVQDADPLVKRAAVAAICEPRLLRSPESAVVAVSVCAAATRALPDMPIAASTGVHTWQDAIKCILAGASAVQLCSTLYKHGAKVIPEMITQIADWMERTKYESVEEFRGRLSLSNAADASMYERTQFMKYISSRETI